MAKRAQEEVAWVQESAVALAKTRAEVTRAAFVVETYMSPEPHVFIPLGLTATCLGGRTTTLSLL